MEVSVVIAAFMAAFNVCLLTQSIGRYLRMFSNELSLCV